MCPVDDEVWRLVAEEEMIQMVGINPSNKRKPWIPWFCVSKRLTAIIKSLSVINNFPRPIFLEMFSFLWPVYFVWILAERFWLCTLKFMQHLIASYMYMIYLIISTPKFLWTYFLPISYLLPFIIIVLVVSSLCMSVGLSNEVWWNYQ